MFRAQRLRVAAVVLLALAAYVAAGSFVALVLAPALVLALVLVAGFFPGERAIERLRALRTRRPARRRRALVTRSSSRPAARRSRLGIAFALANRPPPALPHRA